MSADTKIPVSDIARKNTLTSAAEADGLRKAAADNPESYWADVAGRLDWIKPFSKIKDVSYDADDLHIRWFEDGILNACANCLDRHLPARANDVAIIWEGDDPTNHKKITYAEAFEETCRMANLLKARGVKKGVRHARLRPHRRGALRGIRRLLAGGPGEPD
jgi:acetyl-CoA synthetase